MSKVIEQYATYIYRAHTEVKYFSGWRKFLNFFISIYAMLHDKYWINKIANMSEGQIMDEYYRLTERSEDGDYIISTVVRTPDR